VCRGGGVGAEFGLGEVVRVIGAGFRLGEAEERLTCDAAGRVRALLVLVVRFVVRVLLQTGCNHGAQGVDLLDVRVLPLRDLTSYCVSGQRGCRMVTCQ